MYQPIRPLQRIDDQISTRQSQLYEPLRRSLLKQNLSQSKISSCSKLSVSRVNDLSVSRVSRRLRSMSPQEIEQIKSNTFIPITKRLVPTKNLQVVRNKRFEAIDVYERVQKPIPAIRFNSINRFNSNHVEQIVYQTQDQLIQPIFWQNSYQSSSVQKNFKSNPRQEPRQSCIHNIYTARDSYIAPNFNASQVRQQPPRQTCIMGLNERPIDNFGSKSYVQPAPLQQHYRTHEANYASPLPGNPLTDTGSFMTNTNNMTSFQNAAFFNPSTLPIITSTALQNPNPRTFQNNPTPNLYTSECNPQIRQLPTEHTLSFLGSPLGSRTSFEQEIQKPQTPLNRSYDFSKLSQDTTTSEYKQKKQEEWKYNLFSIFDEPVNTKCSKTGCLKNQIIASRPNLYEWQQ